MEENAVRKLEDFLWDSFEKDGVRVRELRLSDEELDYIKKKWPKATFKKNMAEGNTDTKSWYEVRL